MKMPAELKNPTIHLGELRIDEPITMLTDFLVAGVCFYAFLQIRKQASNSILKRYLKNFFLLTAISTLLGGLLGHGFNYALSIYWKLPYWLISMMGVVLIERGIILFSSKWISKRLISFFSWLNWVELIVFITLAVYFLEFNFVIAHSAYGFLLVISAFNIYIYYKTRNQGSVYFLLGSGILVVGAAIFGAKLNFGHWFNHMDISHVFMAVSGFFFYKGSEYILNEEKELSMDKSSVNKFAIQS